MAESMTKHKAVRFSYPLDLASCTGMGIAMECIHFYIDLFFTPHRYRGATIECESVIHTYCDAY